MKKGVSLEATVTEQELRAFLVLSLVAVAFVELSSGKISEI